MVWPLLRRTSHVGCKKMEAKGAKEEGNRYIKKADRWEWKERSVEREQHIDLTRLPSVRF